MKVLLDTCVIIDVLQKREPFFTDAHEIFLASARNRFAGYITAKSVSDIYYLMHRLLHDDKRTRSALSALFTLFGVLDTTAGDCQLALLSPIGDYEDAVMAETAFRTKMDYIITRNVRDYSSSPVPVYDPHDFLQIIS